MRSILAGLLVTSTLSAGPLVLENEPVILLITAPELATAWKPFADWKASNGKHVRIITTELIDARFEGPDLQEKIRCCVRKCVDDLGAKWVILGGDSQPDGKGLVPDRDTVHKTMWGTNKDIPTDIYYLSPTNWDADGDGIYGEHKDDKDAITYPDGSVGLGRIPVRTAADVAAYTEKVIAHESRYPGKDFANSMVYTCAVAGAYPKVRRSWDDHVSTALDTGSVEHWFADKTPWDDKRPGDYDLSPDNWIKLLNEKRVGKFHLHGHGLINGWVLEKHKMFTAEHVAKLTNEDAYPVITTVSCFTGQYDAKKDPCIVESMLRQPKAGAVAIVAPCREGKPHFLNPRKDFPLMTREGKLDGTTRTMTLFWTNGIANKLSTGHALMATKASMAVNAKKSAEFHLCLAELNLLGDPTLSVHPAKE
jgi:hypothetical protein